MPEEPRSDAGVTSQAGDAGSPDVVAPDVVTPSAVTRPAESVDTGYDVRGVPTFESVREKIETRYATSIGSAELAAETPQGRSVEEQYEARQEAAARRLAEIRASLSKGDAQ